MKINDFFSVLWGAIKHLLGLGDKPYEEPKLKETTPRGLSCFQIMHPRATAQVDEYIDILRRTELKNIGLSVMIDGTFGWDEAKLCRIVRELNKDGRKLHLELYVSNGVSQRHLSEYNLDVFGVMSPNKFNGEIQSNRKLQDEFIKLCQRARGVAFYNNNLGGESRICLMLEDNCSRGAFGAMWTLAKPHLQGFTLVRNPVKNDGYLPDGVLLEQHHTQPGYMNAFNCGIVSNDGRTYNFEVQPKVNNALDLSDYAELRDNATKNRAWFFLWNAKYQGSTTPAKHPNDREYAVPSEEEKRQIVKFLAG